MADPNELRQLLASVATRLARQEPITPNSVSTLLQNQPLAAWTEKQILKTILKISEHYRDRDQLGRLRAALLVGIVLLGPIFVTQVERAGIFLSDKIPFKKFDTFLAVLRSEARAGESPEWTLLGHRLDTYIAYRQLVTAVSADEPWIVALLRTQPRDVIQKVLALTQLHFLQRKFDFEALEAVSAWLDKFGPPEDVASIASILVVLANELRPLDSWDFGVPRGTELTTPEVRRVMEYGNALCQRHQIAKDISYFGYKLEVPVTDSNHPVFYLRPPSTDFEYGQTLGFIRTEIGLSKATSDINTGESGSSLSILSFAEAVAARKGSRLQDIKDENTPFRRVRVLYPTGPEMYEWIATHGFAEDLGDRERQSQDFLIPLLRKGQTEIPLTDKLDLQTFVRIWRYFQFLCCLDIGILRPFQKTDPTILCNSLLRVAKESDAVAVITSAGISEEQAHEFFRLVSADVRKLGYFDLQYRPFLRIAQATAGEITSPPEIIHLSALVASANSMRNVQSANQLRLAANADLFVHSTAEILRSRFKRVQMNREVKSAGGCTDIDVLVLEGETLYLFECKHSVPPTGPHEMRDIWEDIEKGASQLKIAIDALSDASRRANYLRAWFPGIRADEISKIRLAACILCSHRIFAGINHTGIPVRDFSSFAKLVEEGILAFGEVKGDELVMARYRVVDNDGFSAKDLDDYLSSNSRFFKTFRPFMFPLSRFVRMGAITVARETYVYQTEVEDLLKNMEALGYTRLSDERRKWRTPWTAEQILSTRAAEP